MVFTAAQKRAWRKRPEVKARQRRHERNSRAKRISNGQSPHGKRPSELRLPAIMVMGGKCQDCGNDHHAVLNFIHTKPVQRRTNALSISPGPIKTPFHCQSPYSVLQATMASGGVRLATDGGAKIAR
jgi:hypothetical protein